MAQAPARSADATATMQSQCAQCHALKAPAAAELTLDRLWQRKGPDLYYAGSKYNEAWLVKWLQDPKRIRPAGEFYFKNVKPGAKEDVVDESKLTPHVKLSKEDATAFAAALMQLKGSPGLVEKGAYKQQPGSAAMAAMFFNKLRGCSACHQNAPGVGGLSGPELYTGGEGGPVVGKAVAQYSPLGIGYERAPNRRLRSAPGTRRHVNAGLGYRIGGCTCL